MLPYYLTLFRFANIRMADMQLVGGVLEKEGV